MQPAEHTCRIGEHVSVPFETAPFKLLHPETVKMEYFQRNIAGSHAVDKRTDCLLVVICSKRCRKPESEAPFRKQRRAPCEGSVAGKDVFLRTAVNKIIFERFVFY